MSLASLLCRHVFLLGSTAASLSQLNFVSLPPYAKDQLPLNIIILSRFIVINIVINITIIQVWKSRCALTKRKFGGHSTLVLTRWDKGAPPTPDNLVLLMPKEAEALHTPEGYTALPAELRQSISERLAWAKQVYNGDFTYYRGEGGRSGASDGTRSRGSGSAVVAEAARSKEGGLSQRGSADLLRLAAVTLLMFTLSYGRSHIIGRR